MNAGPDITPTTRTMCVIVCAAGPAARVSTLIQLAQRDGWSVRVIATPSAMAMIDADALAGLTGNPVRHDYLPPDVNRQRSSAAEAIIVAPATYNTINKLAAGITDTYALNVLAEAVGGRSPVVIMPFVNTALAARAPFQSAVESLRREGVTILLGQGQWQPHPPGTGENLLDTYPWHRALAATSEGGGRPASR